MPTKRKSDSSAGESPAKKSKQVASPKYDTAKALLADIKSGFEDSEIDFDDKDAVRNAYVEIAHYVDWLEDELERLKKSTTGETTPGKSPERIKEEAKRLRDTTVRGITRLLVWRSTCKTNRTKFMYEGLCTDPLVFGAMLQITGPPKFKLKKMTGREFEELIGRHIVGSARYNDLFISKGNIIIRYDPNTGQFKISGTYGIDIR